MRETLNQPGAPRPGTLEALGWDDGFAEAFAAVASPGASPARVVARHRDRCVVEGSAGGGAAVVAGRLRNIAAGPDALPVTGDWVVVEGGGPDGVSVVSAVLPRRSAFRRKAAGTAAEAQVVAANIDLALVVTALPGDLNARRLERYTALAWESGAVPLVVLTKADLSDDLPAAVADAALAAPGVDIVAVSAATGAGVDDLAALLRPGRTAVLLGSSGVGKSTLVNRLAGEERLRTGRVSGIGKGRHTTTHRELVRLPGGALIIDTPGMREIGLWDAEAGLERVFDEIERLEAGCRFRDCRHETEPACAVLAAIAEGTLAAERLEHWRALRRELDDLERRRDAAAGAARRASDRSAQRALRSFLRRKYDH